MKVAENGKELKCLSKLFLLFYFLYSNDFDSEAVYITHLTFTCSKSAIETLQKVQDMFKVNYKKTQNDLRSGVFIVSFEHISHFFLVFLLLTVSK